MYIDDFLWLPDIVDKLAVKHRVLPEEAEEIFFNAPRFRFVALQPVLDRPTAGRNWVLVRYGKRARPPMAVVPLVRFRPPVL